jgi:predicted TIM-barrel fold metal-dependent hydrolase
MTTATTYSEWLDLVTRLVPAAGDRRAVLAGTAERVYRLSAAGGS